MGTYRDLKVWQVNQECIRAAIRLMEEMSQSYAVQHIAKQLFRSISSVGANIAEGQSSYEGKEFARYIGIALRSAIESDHWLATLENLGLKQADVIKKLEADNIETIKMLKGLKKSIEAKR